MFSRRVAGFLLLWVACTASPILLAQSEEQRVSLFLGGSEVTRQFIKGTMLKVDEAFSQVGIDTYWVNLPTKRSLQMAASGRVDGVYIRREKEDDVYSNLVKIDVPIFYAVGWVWVHPDRSCPGSIEELKTMSAADAVGFGLLDSVPELRGVRRETVTDVRSAFKVLKSRRVDYLVIPELATKYYQKEMGLEFKRCFDKPLYNIKHYTFLHKKHAALIPDLEEAFSRLFP